MNPFEYNRLAVNIVHFVHWQSSDLRLGALHGTHFAGEVTT
jgi:hypothetical protein